MCIEQTISLYRKKGFPHVWVSDLGNGYYRNPILHTDYSDPDIVRVGDDFYMTASSFNNVPGLPILHSTDLVNWRLVNYAVLELPFEKYNSPQYGKAVWAPSIRYHNEYFYIYVGFPDEGIFMTRTKDLYSKWEPLKCIKETRGFIDTCPLWDDDGQVYLINAFAKSRIGFKSVLAINKMNSDGTELLDEFRIVYDGNASNPTIEGPKIYKRNGFYYISAPAGGVKTGWQVILRSKNIYGPYEERIVLHQGDTVINGPHQGGWVELDNDECWFIHFQDKGAYGRIVHLQPVQWVDDWPHIGVDTNNDGIGEPVLTYKKPAVKMESEIFAPLVSDDFDNGEMSLQWQWNGNEDKKWYSLTERANHLRLNAVYEFFGKDKVLWNACNVLSFKFPALKFTTTIKMEFFGGAVGEKAGLVVLGETYYYISLTKGNAGNYINFVEGVTSKEDAVETVLSVQPAESNTVYFRVTVLEGAICQFFYSYNGSDFLPIGITFKARTNVWVGAKVGLFCNGYLRSKCAGYADFDWVLTEGDE